MASRVVQEEWRGMKPGTAAEGTTLYLDPIGPVADLIEHYHGCLRSAITYAGAVNISSFQKLVRFIRVN